MAYIYICSLYRYMVRGYGYRGGEDDWFGWVEAVERCGVGVGGRVSGYFESGLQHSPTQQIPRTQPVKPADDDCPCIEPRSLYGCHCEDIVCLIIRYHENDGSDAVTDSKTSPKTLHQDTDKSLHLLREIGYRSIMVVDRLFSIP